MTDAAVGSAAGKGIEGKDSGFGEFDPDSPKVPQADEAPTILLRPEVFDGIASLLAVQRGVGLGLRLRGPKDGNAVVCAVKFDQSPLLREHEVKAE